MFLSVQASSGADRSPWGDFWFQPAPGAVGAVTGDSALRLTAVYRAVELISGHTAMLPIRLYRPRDDGGRQYLRAHPVLTLLTQRPNALQNAMQFRQWRRACIELKGNAYCQIVADQRGIITDLLPLNPDRVTIEMTGEYAWRYRYKRRDGSEQTLSRSEVWHSKDLSLDGVVGASRIGYARESIGTGLVAQDYGKRFFENDARPPMILKHPGTFKDVDTRNQFRESVQAAQTGSNRGKVMVLEHNIEPFFPTINNADAQFIETKKFTVTEVARLFGVPPHKLADLDRATFSNIEQQALEYYTDALLARLSHDEASIISDLIGADEGICIEFGLHALLRGDATARSAYYQSGIQNGWLTRNEPRIWEGLQPRPELDDPLRPANLMSETAADDAEDDAEQNEPNQDPQQDAEEQDQQDKARNAEARLTLLAASAADRVVRKEMGMTLLSGRRSDWAVIYGPHAKFVSEVLGVSLSAAAAYCNAQIERLQAGNIENFETNTRAALLALALKG